MCGIWTSINNTDDCTDEYIKNIISNVSKLLEHRGPDSMGYKIIKTVSNKTIIMVHTRLHIIGEPKCQPIEDKEGEIYLVINGEIFNWKELSKELDYTCNQSDCEILIPLYKKYIRNNDDYKTFFKKLNGQYSFVLYDKLNDSIFVSRDHIGITPLYFGYDEKKVAFCSEMKCLTMDMNIDMGIHKYKYNINNINVNVNNINVNVSNNVNNNVNNIDVNVDTVNNNINNIDVNVSNNINNIDIDVNNVNNVSKDIIKSTYLDVVKVFQPRTYLNSNLKDIIINVLTKTECYLNYFDLNMKNGKEYENVEIIKKNIKTRFEMSIISQLDDLFTLNVNFGVLLSGGLDSSLVASIISKQSKRREIKQKILTFSIGVNKDSVDLIASRKVAEFLGTEHHEFYFTIHEGLLAIKDTIYYTETYDTTTIRAGTAMYLLTRKIKQKFPELKVLFSGELSDELLCYLYGSNAPNEVEFQRETIKLVSQVHLFDCLRANKTCMANSIEPRVPFTDPSFVKYILRIPAKFKTFGNLRKQMEGNNVMEKQLLRDAFDVLGSDGKKYLPTEILLRSKEAFSDGISTFDK